MIGLTWFNHHFLMVNSPRLMLHTGNRRPLGTRRPRRVEAYRVYLTDGASTRSLIGQGQLMVPEIERNL